MVEHRQTSGIRLTKRPTYKQQQDQLDAVFKALADPTRRRVVDMLSRGEHTLSELASPMPMSLPAVAKHIDVLEHAGIVTHAKTGREKRHRLVREPLGPAEAWIRRYGLFWSQQLTSLDAYISGENKPHGRNRKP
mgnify:CR=1 FL=1